MYCNFCLFSSIHFFVTNYLLNYISLTFAPYISWLCSISNNEKMLMLPCMLKIHLGLITNLTRYSFFVTLYLYTLHCSIDNAYNNKLHPFIYTFLPIFPSLSMYLQKQKFVHQRSLHVKVPTVNAYHSHGCAT